MIHYSIGFEIKFFLNYENQQLVYFEKYNGLASLSIEMFLAPL